MFQKVGQKVAQLVNEEKKEVTQKLSRWRKNDETANKRVKYIYKTIDEVIEEGNDKPAFSSGGYVKKMPFIIY